MRVFTVLCYLPFHIFRSKYPGPNEFRNRQVASIWFNWLLTRQLRNAAGQGAQQTCCSALMNQWAQTTYWMRFRGSRMDLWAGFAGVPVSYNHYQGAAQAHPWGNPRAEAVLRSKPRPTASQLLCTGHFRKMDRMWHPIQWLSRNGDFPSGLIAGRKEFGQKTEFVKI